MSKSKTRFNNPRRYKWSPMPSTMQCDLNGQWVSYEQYNLLNMAYKGALYQLDEAGKHVHATLNKLMEKPRYNLEHLLLSIDNTKMNQQINAIKCAYADLQGCCDHGVDDESHDWKTVRMTIAELKAAFPYTLND